MTIVKWPTVLPDDDGIRPAGRPDQCFYCGSMIGERHGAECVCVLCINRYEVLDKHGNRVGMWDYQEPYYWDSLQCEFHKNDSSWCKGNAVDEIQWCDTKEAQEVRKLIEDEEEGCCCSLISFRFLETIDQGPFILNRDGTRRIG